MQLESSALARAVGAILSMKTDSGTKGLPENGSDYRLMSEGQPGLQDDDDENVAADYRL
jgi:hypothetical protein